MKILITGPQGIGKSNADRHIAIPMTESECDATLKAAEWRLKEGYLDSSDIVRDLARFLGAGSHVWTGPRRVRLDRILSEASPVSVGPILQVVANSPREEVCDHAVRVLSAAIERDDSVAEQFYEILVRTPERPQGLTAPVRETMVRALSRATGPSADNYRFSVLVNAVDDQAPAVREAAVNGLATHTPPNFLRPVIDLLSRVREQEPNGAVAESTDEAIAELTERLTQ